MKRTSILLNLSLPFIIILAGSLSGCSGSRDIEGEADNILANLELNNQSSLDTILTRVGNHFDLPGIAATVTNMDTIIEIGIYGVSNSHSGEPLTADQCFDINSISKAFSALIIMQLIEEDRLSLGTKITDIFPELETTIHADYGKNTVKDFLVHQSGMSRNGRHIDASRRPAFGGTVKERREQFTLWIMQQESNKTYGEFQYSNAGYVVIGAIIDRITGNSFEEETRRRIFKPLEMTSGGFGWPVENADTYTNGHQRTGSGAEPVRYADWYLHELGNSAGGIHLSIRDLTKFSKEQLLGLTGRSRLLSETGYREMHTIEGVCGLGWYESVFSSYAGTEAGGTDDGYRSEIFISEGDSIGITVLTNINDRNDWIACKTIELALLRKYGTVKSE
jgi:CubicO group peptidase (beta-lactamase class C family)